MAGKHDVYVFLDGQTFKARPALAAGVANKPFKFRNLTDSTLVVEFPDGLMDKPEPNIGPKKSKTYHVGSKADGLYEYSIKAVLKGKRKKKVRGESGPRIVIDP
jgi:hypothetical protein